MWLGVQPLEQGLVTLEQLGDRVRRDGDGDEADGTAADPAADVLDAAADREHDADRQRERDRQEVQAGVGAAGGRGGGPGLALPLPPPSVRYAACHLPRFAG